MASTVLFVGAVAEDGDDIMYQIDADTFQTAVSPYMGPARPPSPPPEGTKIEVRLKPLADLINVLPVHRLETFVNDGLTGNSAQARALLLEARAAVVDAKIPADADLADRTLAVLRTCARQACVVVTVGCDLVAMHALEPALASEVAEMLTARTLSAILAQNLLLAYINVVAAAGAVLATSVHYAMLKPAAALMCAVVPQSQREARLTFFAAKATRGVQGAAFAKHMLAELHFLNEEAWQNPVRLIFHFFDEREPLNLVELFGSSHDADAHAARNWAQRAWPNVNKAAFRAGLKPYRSTMFRVADPKACVFLLASWDPLLHDEAKRVLTAMPSLTLLGAELSEAIVPQVAAPDVPLSDSKPALAPAELARLTRLDCVFANPKDADYVRAMGALDSRSYLGEARKLLFERLREIPAGVSGAAERLRYIKVANNATTHPLFDTVQHLDSVGVWGGRSLAHCLWSFLRALWRGPEVLLTPIGDQDDRTPMEVGSCVVVRGAGAQPSDRHVTVYGETNESLKERSTSEYDDEAIVSPLPLVAEGCMRLYHATSVNNVTNIVAKGVDLNLCPGDTSDFGKGFYMTPDVGCAYHFLITEAPVQPYHHPRALLAVDVDKEGLSQLKEARLYKNYENYDTWTRVVRNETDALSRDVRRQLREAEMLVGPLTTRLSGRKFLGISDEEPYLQHCFVDPELIDPKKYLDGLEDSLVRAVYVVRLLLN
jgi:hypothetical protein